jgi:hypothetical protein
MGDHIIIAEVMGCPSALECLDGTCIHYDNCDLTPGSKKVHHEPRLKGLRNDHGEKCLACLDWEVG